MTKVKAPAELRTTPADSRTFRNVTQPYHSLSGNGAPAVAAAPRRLVRRGAACFRACLVLKLLGTFGHAPTTKGTTMKFMLTDRKLHPRAKPVAADFKAGGISRREYVALMAGL